MPLAPLDAAPREQHEEALAVHDEALAVLVEAARAGDREAFASLHHRFVRLVRGIVMARRGTKDLEDRVQTVFTIALSKIEQLREPAAFGSWLARIARSETSRRPVRFDDDVNVDELGAPDSPRAEAEEVLALVRALPEAYAEPLVLRLVFGMTGEEIATELGLSPGYVRVNLHRGMAKLRELLDLEGGQGQTGGARR